MYIVHVSSEAGVAAIAESKGRRAPVFGEVLHNYLAFTSEAYAVEEYQLYHNYPPLKYADDQGALWRAIAAGDLDTVASDDLTIPKAAKLSGKVVDNVPGGHNGIETRMDIIFSEGVAKNRLTLQQFVRLTSEAPAQLFGLFPQKRTMAIGSDADFAVIDPNVRHVIRLGGGAAAIHRHRGPDRERAGVGVRDLRRSPRACADRPGALLAEILDW